MASFATKTVIITGSSAGIGREAALLFAIRGANVVIHGQSENKLKDVVAALEAAGVKAERYLVVQGPIQDEKTRDALINETIKKFGQIDVLVNNAGIRNDPKDEDWNSLHNMDYLYNVNFRSMYDLNEKAYPHLVKTKGNIINISSVGAKLIAPRLVPYCITKAAMDAYTAGFAVRWGPEVRVNSVNPGPIITDFTIRHQNGEALLEVGKEKYSKLPARRMGTPQEVANTILFIASDDASYMTGSTIVVDGGYLPGLAFAQ
ncbi:unnamed protein product [Bursaphelenchus xylophilus]|uniref:(pine wood nematode) hypothetical protein n=1 Tax=Bursaphelenchus xylophilus TaxID=6326 RepID=A0A1I7SUP2_BURXY|nr:unnamed protein product [Bursaphelenchus xylophilus]CAG9125983.1 unnamed protein product [Bursaphelenchus xylophilus]